MEREVEKLPLPAQLGEGPAYNPDTEKRRNNRGGRNGNRRQNGRRGGRNDRGNRERRNDQRFQSKGQTDTLNKQADSADKDSTPKHRQGEQTNSTTQGAKAPSDIYAQLSKSQQPGESTSKRDDATSAQSNNTSKDSTGANSANKTRSGYRRHRRHFSSAQKQTANRPEKETRQDTVTHKPQ